MTGSGVHQAFYSIDAGTPSSPLIFEVKNEWSWTSIPHVMLLWRTQGQLYLSSFYNKWKDNRRYPYCSQHSINTYFQQKRKYLFILSSCLFLWTSQVHGILACVHWDRYIKMLLRCCNAWDCSSVEGVSVGCSQRWEFVNQGTNSIGI